MFEDADLRRLLTSFRDLELYSGKDVDLESRRHCILRRAMIDHLGQPRSVQGWRLGLPGYLLGNTEPEHWQLYAPRVIELVRRIARAGS
jgi:hypothetical protein